ncbi:hypothetical protein ACFVZ3_07805 [Kitasatospora purpeofusca]|uniref:hypothetical protein n=1 Tax=Kitasatospora purpeofusca TaxID=67352 RepID=UPI003677C514
MRDRRGNSPTRYRPERASWWSKTREQRRRLQRRFIEGIAQGIGMLLARLLGHFLP